MENWYNNSEVHDLEKKINEALINEDIESLRNLAEMAEQKCKDIDNELLQARFFSVSLSALDFMLDLESAKSNIPNYAYRNLGNKDTIEHRLYLARKIFYIYKKYYENISYIPSTEDNIIRDSFYVIAINYSFLLFKIGRTIESINILNSCPVSEIPVAKGYFGSYLLSLASSYHGPIYIQDVILHYSYQNLCVAIEKANYTYTRFQLKYFVDNKSVIEDILTKEELENDYTITNMLQTETPYKGEEANYREWIAKNKLALTILNELDNTNFVGYDPIHLSRMSGVGSLEKPKKSAVIFNQIKQEYVSARFLLYEAISTDTSHFSDREVLIQDIKDNAIFGLGIEKMKLSFRACYSIFDTIAYFLNEYFDLGINPRDVKFAKIWNAKVKGTENYLTTLTETNKHLRGLWWLSEDFCKKNPPEYQFDELPYKRIGEIRNYMEHRYIKIVKDKNSEDDKAVISYLDFERYTLELFETTREAIMLLTFIVKYVEEGKNVDFDKIPQFIAEIYPDTDKVVKS